MLHRNSSPARDAGRAARRPRAAQRGAASWSNPSHSAALQHRQRRPHAARTTGLPTVAGTAAGRRQSRHHADRHNRRTRIGRAQRRTLSCAAHSASRSFSSPAATRRTGSRGRKRQAPALPGDRGAGCPLHARAALAARPPRGTAPVSLLTRRALAALARRAAGAACGRAARAPDFRAARRYRCLPVVQPLRGAVNDARLLETVLRPVAHRLTVLCERAGDPRRLHHRLGRHGARGACG